MERRRSGGINAIERDSAGSLIPPLLLALSLRKSKNLPDEFRSCSVMNGVMRCTRVTYDVRLAFCARGTPIRKKERKKSKETR